MSENNPVGWFEIYVEDLARAKSFYEDLLDIELRPLDADTMPEFLAFPAGDGYGATGALACVDGMTPGGNSVMVYFECNDCGTTSRRAADAGGKVVQDRFPIGQFGFCALVEDSEGNLIGLHSET